ncbi:MAG: phenylalanine--tRNA ligase subunit beta [Crocinitomix sp.]|nr:phenylalanine--tRNA ligase subunit beta [Crocinitomix sp.]
MKISYNWLKTYIDTDLSAQRVAEILTDTGLEVEGLEKVETIKGGLEGVVIGHVLTKEPHPDADRLNVTTVSVGTGEPVQIVCGAPNVAAGQKVVVATVGSTLYPSPEEPPLKIKKSKIRGIESFGMICAEDELGLGQSHDGIMVLDAATEVGLTAKEFFNIEDDYLIEIGLTPNRADAMGHYGVARDLKAYLNYHEGANLSLKTPAVADLKEGSESVSISIENTDACPRYAGAVITGVKVTDSPDWLQNRLRSIGLAPINNIVDITNFVMHEIGNPLHAFDLDTVNGAIVVRKAKNGEKLVTLDEVERELDENDLMICNATEAMCIAGVFGGLKSGVKTETKSIFLEAAYFNPVSIRKSAKRQGLNTDASFRFERGIDPNSLILSRDRAISLILEITGGKLETLHDQYPAKIEDFEVVFSFDRCRKLCGANISDEDIVTILEELDIKMISDSEEEVVLKVPAYRVDVQREVDVIEEVLRIYGFNNVPLPEKLNTSLSFQEKPNKENIYNVTANLLADNGFAEIMNNSLTSSANWNLVNSEVLKAEHDVRLLNPLSNELDVMRQTMLFGGLRSIEFNQNRQHPDLRLFEFGSVYNKVEGKYSEAKKMGLWITGVKEVENWSSTGQKSSFHTLKGATEAVLQRLGVFKAPRIGELTNDFMEDGYSLTIANKPVVELGWIKPEILKAFGIKQAVYYAEFNWDVVIDISIMNKINFKPIPKTQFARRDFSLLLDKSVQFGQIQSIAQKADRKILKEIGLFDVYEGKNLEKGKKSYAVSFIFQDDEKTLKDKQIDAIMAKIRQGLEGQLGAELR